MKRTGLIWVKWEEVIAQNKMYKRCTKIKVQWMTVIIPCIKVEYPQNKFFCCAPKSERIKTAKTKLRGKLHV